MRKLFQDSRYSPDKRGQLNGIDIPMCGVPVHAVDGYLEKLIRLGHRVAVCEQAETPESFKKEEVKDHYRALL